jgi:hypothetical protein
VSLLPLFIQFSGGCFWRTLCFILHPRRSALSSHDGLFHQLQIILRNAATALDALSIPMEEERFYAFWSLLSIASYYSSAHRLFRYRRPFFVADCFNCSWLSVT